MKHIDLFGEHLLVLEDYLLLEVLLKVRLLLNLVILQPYLISTPHQQVLVTHIDSAGTSLDLVIYQFYLVHLKQGHTITTRHRMISGQQMIMV